jgi:hypothetical protein
VQVRGRFLGSGNGLPVACGEYGANARGFTYVMSQGTSTTAPRSWAVRLLLVCMLAVCALMMHAPHGAAAAMAPAGHSTSGSTAVETGPRAVSNHGTQGTQATKTATETAISLHAGTGAHDQRGDGCSCCPTPLDIVIACAAVDTGLQQHGTLPQTLDEDAFVTPDLASSGSATQRAAPPPSLAELSLLRI